MSPQKADFYIDDQNRAIPSEMVIWGSSDQSDVPTFACELQKDEQSQSALEMASSEFPDSTC